MAEFLTAVSTKAVKRSKEPVSVIGVSPTNSQNIDLDSPEEIAKVLKNQPDLESLGKILKHLVAAFDKQHGFNLVTPGPISAQVVDILVTKTIPDYWRTLKDSGRYVKQLIRCLRSANGLGAILSRLRPLITDCRQKKPASNTRDASVHIEDIIDVLEHVLHDDRATSQIWTDMKVHAQNPIQKKLMWKEYVTQVGSGRILSVVAEAEDALKERVSERKASWLGNGKVYASWLGCNMAILIRDDSVSDRDSPVPEFCGKALGLGYLDAIVASIVKFALDERSPRILQALLLKLKAHEQRKYFNAISTVLTKQYFGASVETKTDAPVTTSTVVSSVASLIHSLVKDNELLRNHLVASLTQSTIPALDGSLAARRSAVAAITQDEEKLQTLLEKCLKLFGDSFYIAHTPILQQEGLAQTLAITCGYIHRSQPIFLTMMAKSSHHVTGISNRMGATSPRARFLGMAIGTAISKLVDKPELQLKFDLEGDEDIEAKWYQRLTHVDDKLGDFKDLSTQVDQRSKNPNIPKQIAIRAKTAKPAQQASKKLGITEVTGPRIVEIFDEEDSEDDDLLPYEKPDSDPEDETDDPTEINRDKPTAPVYIRDLIAGLRDNENYDRHQLALSTAASLIRRKTNFGTEVIDHIEELASILTGLQDNFELSEFNEQRQQALIAVLLARPGPMAQWFAASFFSGDYSLMQRVAMLTTLGLGARELARLKDHATENLIPVAPAFPSKTLPPNLHKIYAENTNPVARITNSLTKQLLSPIAAEAADQLSGPNILKVRTFSSRMEVEKRRSKPISNELAKIVADNFFFPLTGRWWMNVRSSGSGGLYTSSHLLPPFLHTLALLLNASGPNTLALSQMTREFWELLLSVRTTATNDKGVLSALLFAFLVLLETNEDKERLATEQAKELLETQEWVRLTFEQLGAGSDEDEKIRVLAAGVIVRCQEVVEKYQRKMVGSMLDY